MAELFTPATKLTTIDVKRKAGATLGAKLLAAYNALPATGGVLDCRRMSGAQSTGGVSITVTKPNVEFLFGASVITVTANDFIYFQNGASFGDRTGAADGCKVLGAGEDVTQFKVTNVLVTSVFKIRAFDVKLEDLMIWHTDPLAVTKLIDLNNTAAEGSAIGTLRPYMVNVHLRQGAANSDENAPGAGVGILIGRVYFACVDKSFIANFNYGIHLTDNGTDSGAVNISNVTRIYKNNEGIRVEGGAGVNLVGQCIVEGNAVWGMHVLATFSVNSYGTHWENSTGTGQVLFADIPGDAFEREASFYGDSFVGSGVQAIQALNSSGSMRITCCGGGSTGDLSITGAGAKLFKMNFDSQGTETGTITSLTEGRWKGNGVLSLTLDTWNVINGTKTTTALAGNVLTAEIDLDINSTANSAVGATALLGDAFIRAGNVRNYTNAITGVSGIAEHRGSGVASVMRGVFAETQLASAGTISSAAGLTARINNGGAGIITEGIGVLVNTPLNTGGGTITTFYGLAIADVGTVAGTSYAIATFGGSLLFSLTAAASQTIRATSTTESNLFYLSSATNSLGLGVPPIAESRLFAFMNITTINAEYDTIVAQMQYNPAANSTGTGIGIASNTFTPSGNGNNPGKIVGLASVADHRGSGALTNGWAMDSNAVNRNAGAVTNLVGLHIEVDNLNAAGTVGTGYGILIEPVFNAGTMGTYAGIWVFTPTAASDNYALITQGGKVIFNNGSLDADLRMKGDNNDPVFFMDASADSAGFGTTTPSAQVHISSFVVASGNPVLFRVTEAGHTNITATAEKLSVDFALDQTIQHATGNIGTQRAFVIRPPTYSFVGASNITTAATVAITGAPVAGTLCTFTGNTLALWIQSGQSLFQGGLLAERTIGTCTALGAGPIGLAANFVRAVFSNEGATAIWELDLPSAVAGLEYEFVVQDADGVRVVAAGGDTIRLAGSVSAAAGKIESTTIGSTVKLVAINATEWVGIAINGSWTVT